MEITEFREFNPCLFATVHDTLSTSSAKPNKLSGDALDILHALHPVDLLRPDKHAELDDELNLLRAAAKLQRFFVIRPPEAPRLFFCGGEFLNDPTNISVGGIGLSFADAFRRCIGEAVEYLSQVENLVEESIAVHRIPLQNCPKSWPASWLRCAIHKNLPFIDCVQARDLDDGSDYYLPADLCMRRSKKQLIISYKLSSGCAVGRTFDDALCKGISEVIEHDAVALWWYGGNPARQFSQDWLQKLGILELLKHCRGSYKGRHTVFLDVSTDLKIPSVVAYSFDASGSNFVCGMAAHPNVQKALEAAFLELCQMELGLSMVHLKIKQRGMDALNEGNRQQLLRASRMHPNCFALAAGKTAAPPYANRLLPKSNLDVLKDCINHTSLKAYFIDITKQSLKVPAVKVLLPELQAAVARVLTNRLQSAINTYSGGWGLINQVDLY